MRKSRYLASCLLLALMTQTAGCDTPPPAEPEIRENSVDTVVEETEEVQEGLLYNTTAETAGALGLDGYTFRLFVRAQNQWDNTDLVVEEANGEVYNDAVYNRMIALEDTFGFTMELGRSADTNANEIGEYILAGDTSYDLAFPKAGTAGSLATQGMFLNLYDLPYFDVDSGDWSKLFCDSLTWRGKLYMAAGGISTNAYSSIRLFMFNKDIHRDNQFEDLYALAREGRWTLDVMHNMATAAATDLNGDGTMTIADDRWGMAWQKSMGGMVLFYGAGEALTKVDENGVPVMALGSDRSHQAFDTIQQMIADENVYLIGSDSDGAVIFQEGRSLFYTEGMHLLEYLRDYDVDFGALPMPKLNEEQETYIQYVDSHCPSPVVVPNTVQNPERCGFLIQLLAETGTEMIKPAFYDKCLTGKYLRDDQSAEMLDIVVQNFVLDPAVIYNWSGMQNAFVSAFTGKAGLASFIASKEKALATSIQTADEAFSSFSS